MIIPKLSLLSTRKSLGTLPTQKLRRGLRIPRS